MSALKPIEDAARDVPSDLASLREDIAKLTATVAAFVSKQTAETTESVVGAVDGARRKIAETADDAQERMSGASAELEASIERNPFLAVLLALSSGFVIGILSRGRK